MKMVLKAKKETHGTTPLPCKIKAKAVFESQEAHAEMYSQPWKPTVTHLSVAQDSGTAVVAQVPLDERSTDK